MEYSCQNGHYDRNGKEDTVGIKIYDGRGHAVKYGGVTLLRSVEYDGCS